MSMDLKTDPVLPLTVAISSRALFDLEDSHQVFEQQGIEAYHSYQIDHEEDLLQPGFAYALVQKLLALNEASIHRVEVVLVSRNSADTGLRIFNTIESLGLDIKRAVFTNGRSPVKYLTAFKSGLFLSTHHDDVQRVLAAGLPAATIWSGVAQKDSSSQLKIAFDGDAVLFSDESEQIYQTEGLEAFVRNEVQSVDFPLNPGPFKQVLMAIQAIQESFPLDQSPIRTALVTARSAPAHKRVILTLRKWGIRIDESVFLGGLPKGDFLRAFGADIFFDDQAVHCESASEHVATGHVPSGVASKKHRIFNV